jgi:hypothetical protein
MVMDCTPITILEYHLKRIPENATIFNW